MSTCTVPESERFAKGDVVPVPPVRSSKPHALRGKSGFAVIDEIAFDVGLQKLAPTQLRAS